MPHLDTPYKYEKMLDYPHMRPADEAIWTRFIEKNPDRFVRVFYDYCMGEPDAPDEDVSAHVASAWYDLTRWKCDVVAYDHNKVYAIEVKPNANAKALGQAASYAMLLKLEHGITWPIIPVVLTDAINPITKVAADALGVELWTA